MAALSERRHRPRRLVDRLRVLLEHDTLELLLEPLNGVLLRNAVRRADAGLAAAAAAHAESLALEANVEVHACATST